ncbi:MULTISPECIES: MFS transporter [unclassified Pseudomonas]|uniref:MFS transporter n=1 Tax=unclassified Pseudomonas TaxID=196821 RepID=UPI0008761922|nr:MULTISPECIES: MFS transporter [unclassified Pseudomonas]SCZ32153.1 Predicted arabinose efflux permease, MFS family [Pseudomonas sp. NFACC44-2]SDA50218.1 Predicted arabinose efflux permease, MFS family [Pseudomonas sp. NFACC51]SEJ38488.1 Predicted arabinose efflux permease, MFS family [Pseudomonas sp. NFACC07-1]SFH59190.1 Predicted arabinose efflux permease, MFS family [Pseudomonas sp. NFACC54]SFT11762.1 Predicted arabinose efflux permease, MFS family [Pseudomonas sp. NFACC48-1]
MNPSHRHSWGLAFGLCLITLAVNLQAPLYTTYAQLSGYGAGATAVAFSGYVLGVLPVLLAFGGLADRVGRKPLILVALGLSMLATLVTLLWPSLEALGVARLMMGVGTGLASATSTAYMAELMATRDPRSPANRVTASTSLGFGLGAALTSLFLFVHHSATPGSFWLQLMLAAMAIVVVWRLPDPAQKIKDAPLLRLPLFPAGSLPYSFSMLLAWATSGLVIAILPSVLATRDLQRWSGLSTFTVISCGLLFQPWVRRMQPARATGLGLLILPASYALLAWGASAGSLLAVLLGALGASSACYGFLYLGGLSAVTAMAGAEKARVSAGFFLFAYVGFSIPVVVTGLLADHFGADVALIVFGLALLAGVSVTGWRIVRTEAYVSHLSHG